MKLIERLANLKASKELIMGMNVTFVKIENNVGGRAAANGHYRQFFGAPSWTPEEEGEIRTRWLALYSAAIEAGMTCAEAEDTANRFTELFKKKLWKTRGRYRKNMY